MTERLIVDTGVLVAAFERRDQWAPWVANALKSIHGPLVTCEPVLAETWFLLQDHHTAWAKVEKWLDRGFLKLAFSLEAERKRTFALMDKYRNLPMSLADACLVRMVELGIGDRVFTLDEHFRIYRHSGRRVVPVLMPE